MEIRYEVEGQFVTASTALVAGDTTRQRIRYDSDLTVWVNWRAEPWVIEGRTLPQWGFLALGPGTEVCTALRDGKLGDYAECPEYFFADARTWFDIPYLHSKKDIEPRLRSFKHLGGNRIQVTYEWIVKDTLDKDYHCFVHGVNNAETSGQSIIFQGDHDLPKPTSQWRPGDVIVDGPHELAISDRFNTYDLTIGLYKNDRVRLQGLDEGGNRIILASLKIGKEAGKITSIVAEKPTATPQAVPPEADFKAHTNPSGTWIDFGAIATDGAVKINREQDRLVIFPYPRERAFRVSLDLKALAPAANLSRVQVHALAAGDQRDLGPVEFKTEKGRIAFTLGTPQAGRYVLSWQ